MHSYKDGGKWGLIIDPVDRLRARGTDSAWTTRKSKVVDLMIVAAEIGYSPEIGQEYEFKKNVTGEILLKYQVTQDDLDKFDKKRFRRDI